MIVLDDALIAAGKISAKVAETSKKIEKAINGVKEAGSKVKEIIGDGANDKELEKTLNNSFDESIPASSAEVDSLKGAEKSSPKIKGILGDGISEKNLEKQVLNQGFDETIPTSYIEKSETSKSLLETVENSEILSPEQKQQLLSELDDNKYLRELIQEDPSNIERWQKSQPKEVDLSKIQRTDKGELPPGYQNAGRTVYLHPAFLPKDLRLQLEANGKINIRGYEVTEQDLIKHFKEYPDGVTYGENGLPDFTNVTMRKSNGDLAVEKIEGGLKENSNKDRVIATNQLEAKGEVWDHGQYTWHHVPGTNEVQLVDWYYHAFCNHAGGRAISEM